LILPRRPLGAVLDLDGTLIDSESLVREAYFDSCRDLGVSISDTQFLTLVGKNRDDNDAMLREFFGADFPLQQLHEANRCYIGERTAPLKPGAPELLEALARMRAPIALATSSGPAWVERHFTAHQLTHRFLAIVTRVDCERGKPHPEPYERACRALGLAPATALAVEDSHTGVRSAHAAGCMVVMAPDLQTPDDEMREKALIVGSLHDVVAMLA